MADTIVTITVPASEIEKVISEYVQNRHLDTYRMEWEYLNGAHPGDDVTLNFRGEGRER